MARMLRLLWDYREKIGFVPCQPEGVGRESAMAVGRSDADQEDLMATWVKMLGSLGRAVLRSRRNADGRANRGR